MTGIRLYAINAGGVILAFDVAKTIVDVRLAAIAGVSGRTLTAETSLFLDDTSGIIATRITVASINHKLAVFSVIARLTKTLIVTLRHRNAFGLILTRIRVAGIAFGQNVIADASLAGEAIGRGGEYQLILHIFGFSTTCYARLNVIQFDQIRKPFQRTIAI